MTEDDLVTRLAMNIKALRKSKNFTQFSLAEKADISEMTIKKIETGKQWPSEKTLIQIVNALEVDIYTLFLPVYPTIKIDKKVKADIEKALQKTYLSFVESILQDNYNN